jgi:hypothetical protein
MIIKPLFFYALENNSIQVLLFTISSCIKTLFQKTSNNQQNPVHTTVLIFKPDGTPLKTARSTNAFQTEALDLVGLEFLS